MTNILIIGAGPAGLAAARSAREQGAVVTLLDSSEQLGGQYWRHLPEARPAAREASLHHGWSTFQRLRSTLEADPGCTILTSAQVWSIEGANESSPGTVHVLLGSADGSDREQRTITPDALILATGAYDRTLPFPGWDLPGVFTGGAAQALAKGERIAVGERVVVSGAGPFLLPVAASLAATGAIVPGVFEANRLGTLMRGWLPRPWQLVGAAAKGLELAGYARGHLRHRIPYRLGEAVVAAHGTDRVTSVTVARLNADWTPVEGSHRVIEADAVCVSHGFTPRLELAISVGCALTESRFVRVDADQRTSNPHVFAVGEITGIGGVDLAMAEGEIAGAVAALGSGSEQTSPARAARGRRRVFTGFAARIEAAHGIRPGWSAWLEPSTIVCRCEEVTFDRLCRTAEATASQSLRSLKLTTRAGLGICQGRVCGRTVEQLLGAATAGGRLTDQVMSDRRPIAAPIRLAELARARAAASTNHASGSTPQDPTKGQK